MKKMKMITVAAVLISISVGAAAEKPSVMPEAMLSITVSDLHGFIDGAGEVIAQVSPMMNGAMLKNMVGMQIGDPGLMGIAPGKGIAIIAMDPTNIFAVVEVSEAQSAAYTEVVANLGMQSAYTNDVLVLGQTSELVTKGIGLSGSVQDTLLKKRSADLRFAFQPAAIMERNSELITGFMDDLPTMMSSAMMLDPNANSNTVEMTSKIMEAEMIVLLSIAGQCEAGEIVIAPVGGSLQVTETIAPKTGTRLAAMMDSPKNTEINPHIQSGVLGDGMILIDFALGNPEVLTAFVSGEMDNLFEKMESLDGEVVKSVVAYKSKWMKVIKGAGCETVDFDADDGMAVSCLIEVADETAALELLKTMSDDIVPFMKLYEDMGVPFSFTFKENVGEHAGIKLHRLETDFETGDMPEEQKVQLELLDIDGMDYDIAIFDGMMLYTMGDGAITNAIDHIKNQDAEVTPIAARKVYPEGGFYYADLEVGRYMEMLTAFVPPDAQSPMFPQLIAMMQGVDPITSAGFREDGCFMWSINIPGDLIGKLGQIGMMMQAQQQMQSAPAQ